MAEAQDEYVAPAGMDDLTVDTVQDWIATHLNPNEGQLTHMLEHVYPELNQVLTTCRLTPQQKYAVLRQGVQKIGNITMLGSSVEDIRSIFKGFDTLTETRGRVNFGAIHYTCIFLLVLFTKDKRCRDQEIDADDFTQDIMEYYISKAEAKEAATEKSELDLPSPPTLGDSNFHKWEQSIYANLLSKVGTRGVPLAYVVRKDTAPDTYVDDAKHLIYKASQQGASWDEDNKTVGNYITSLLMGKPAETWIKHHIKAQDGRAMMTALRIHFLGQSQKEKLLRMCERKRTELSSNLKVSILLKSLLQIWKRHFRLCLITRSQSRNRRKYACCVKR